jgi:hypothetical protein
MAKFYEDDQEYEAEILRECKTPGMFRVVFTEYGNEQVQIKFRAFRDNFVCDLIENLVSLRRGSSRTWALNFTGCDRLQDLCNNPKP